MTDVGHQPRVRASRARTLGDAVPVIRSFRDADDPKIVAKTSDELRADAAARRDAAPMTTSCAVDGCHWSYEGTAGECRKQAATHRGVAHPKIAGRRTYRKPGRIGGKATDADIYEARRRRQERDEAQQIATINRGRALRGEPLLEEVASADGVPGATSSSSLLDDLAEIEPEPETDGPALEAAAPTRATLSVAAPTPAAAAPSGEISASNTRGGTTMENPYGLKRSGRGYVWTTNVAIMAVREYRTLTGRWPRKQDAREEPTGTLPGGVTAEKLFGSWDEMIRVADGVADRPAPLPAVVPDGGTLAALARELEDARVDVNRANTRWLDAVRAFKAHDVIRSIGDESDVAA